MIEPLASDYTVIVPDLPGHGQSGPGGDYSVGGLAAGLRDLLLTLGHRRATVVGHSLGGGVAMQFTYQFPEFVERLALVSSGGIGPEVSPVLRAATLPGADLFIGATADVGTAGRLARRQGPQPPRPAPRPRCRQGRARLHASLSDSDRRAAFLATVRAVIGAGGPRIDAADHLPGRGGAGPDSLRTPMDSMSSQSATARPRTEANIPAAATRS